MNKAELRRSLLKTRQALEPEVWRAQSDRLCENLRLCPQFVQAKTVLAYFSFRQEPDLTPLFSLAKTWGFPRCAGRALQWHKWSPNDDPPQPGAYGILDPAIDSPVLTADRVDLMLVPCVACDSRRYRLGYGGGFYDRLLSSPEWARIPTIGVVFEFARLPSLTIDEWDQPLQAICTERGLFA